MMAMKNFITNLIIFVSILIVAMPSISGAPQTHTWWVDSSSGSDTAGTGSEAKPFKTITYALSKASDRGSSYGDTVKVKAASIYSTANGEIFPLRLKRNVKLVGVGIRTSYGMFQPVIRGGASYAIPDASRYVSVIGANGASISGFKFMATNSAGRQDGTSILCDSTSPTIQKNEFTCSGSAHAGITTLGTAHPLIKDNKFTGASLGWGITAYGESYPDIEDNTFSVWNGIDCTDHSHPVIEGNTIATRSTGISTKGWSTANIVGNTIRDNEDWGIMVRMDSTPAIQDNQIKNNPVGIYIGEGNPVPDIGGGGRSLGNNAFDNTEWNIENHSNVAISAKNNDWLANCYERIDAKIYDNDENPLSGAVNFGTYPSCYHHYMG
jgi:parallel beta-helix repeat protein